MDTAPHQPAPSRGRRFRLSRGDGRHVRRAPRDGQRPSRRDGRGSRWLLASTGLVLLAVSVVMMTYGAQPSRAQTVRPAEAPARLRLPVPDGRYQVGTVSLHLIDRARPNPWTASPPYRELMVSLFYPARDAARYPVAPQMLPAAAAHFGNTTAKLLYGTSPGTVNWAATLSHAHTGAPVLHDASPWPVLLYSPGAGDDRTFGTVMAENLASRGYVVVAIDHTYDASEVEFPSGHRRPPHTCCRRAGTPRACSRARMSSGSLVSTTSAGAASRATCASTTSAEPARASSSPIRLPSSLPSASIPTPASTRARLACLRPSRQTCPTTAALARTGVCRCWSTRS